MTAAPSLTCALLRLRGVRAPRLSHTGTLTKLETPAAVANRLAAASWSCSSYLSRCGAAIYYDYVRHMRRFGEMFEEQLAKWLDSEPRTDK